MLREPGSIVRPDPLAFFLTWTTYGSWLPGDARGWTDSRGEMHQPVARLRASLACRMPSPAVTLSADERLAVEQGITTLCENRGWHLHAMSCRSQHVHVVVTASRATPAIVMQQLKAWASRSLDALPAAASRRSRRRRWWTRGGSLRLVFSHEDLEAVVTYVAERQGASRYE